MIHRATPPVIALAFLLTQSVVAQESSVLDHTMHALSGEQVNLAEKYAGKVVLFVNVASRCGLTPQYEGLEALYRQYAERDFVIVGVPCNQFGAQEPGTPEEIATFCEKNYGVTFDLLEKVNVNPPEQCALYEQLTQTEPAGPIRWNFAKFLVDRTGAVVGRYEPQTKPDDPALVADIESVLAE